jgi:hypothetical protein
MDKNERTYVVEQIIALTKAMHNSDDKLHVFSVGEKIKFLESSLAVDSSAKSDPDSVFDDSLRPPASYITIREFNDKVSGIYEAEILEGDPDSRLRELWSLIGRLKT